MRVPWIRRKVKKRTASLARKTREVDIRGEIVIDGSGKTEIHTGFPPLDHLLGVFAFHGLFDLSLEARGDLAHHIIEDIGIALGKALTEALGDKRGIRRYGCFSLAMDKVVVEAAIDISGRPALKRRVSEEERAKIEAALANDTFDDTNFSFKDAEKFLEAFINHAGISLVYHIKSGEGDLHHLLEALFKAIGKSLDEATQIDPRRKGVPSTKGVID